MESDNLEFILDHFKNPRNYGTIEDADFSYEEGIPSCGDVIRLDLRIKNNKLDDIKFSGTGCAISQASVSILTENVAGMEVSEVLSLTDNDLLIYRLKNHGKVNRISYGLGSSLNKK